MLFGNRFSLKDHAVLEFKRFFPDALELTFYGPLYALSTLTYTICIPTY